MQNFDHIIGQIDKRLARIETNLDRFVDSHEDRHLDTTRRLAALEQTKAEVAGGWKVVSVIGALAGAIGGLATRYLWS
jgi:hypothetical protein